MQPHPRRFELDEWKFEKFISELPTQTIYEGDIAYKFNNSGPPQGLVCVEIHNHSTGETTHHGDFSREQMAAQLHAWNRHISILKKGDE